MRSSGITVTSLTLLRIVQLRRIQARPNEIWRGRREGGHEHGRRHVDHSRRHGEMSGKCSSFDFFRKKTKKIFFTRRISLL